MIEEIDIGRCEKAIILAGSHNHITIKKEYGPSSRKDLVIVWEKDGWSVLNRRRVKEVLDNFWNNHSKSDVEFERSLWCEENDWNNLKKRLGL